MNKSVIHYVLILFWIFATIPLARSEVTSDQALTLYQVETANAPPSPQQQRERLQLIERIHSGQFGPPENYATRTRLRLKTQPDHATFHYPFPLPNSLSLSPGWSRQDHLILWRPGDAPPAPLAIPLHLATDFPLGDYRSFQLDFTSLPPFATCTPSLQLTLGDASNPQVLRTAGPSDLQEIHSFTPSLDPWAEKGLGYLLSRQINLASDDRWYYAQNEHNVVIQRRMNQDITTDTTLELVFAPGAALDLINLRVVGPDGSSKLLLNDQLQPRAPLTDGRNGWRIGLTAALRTAFPQEIAANQQTPSQHRFYLQEIFIFTPGQATQIVNTQPLRRIALLGNARVGNAPASLPNREEGLDLSRRRFTVDLEALQELSDPTPRQTQLWLSPPADASPCALRLDQLRLTGNRERQIPQLIAPITGMIQHWGSPFPETVLAEDQIEAPRDLAYLDFVYLFTTGAEAPSTVVRSPAITSQDSQRVSNSFSKEKGKIGKSTQRFASAKSIKQSPAVSSLTPVLLASQGATLSAPRATTPRISIENSQMMLEAEEGNELRLDWPTDVVIGPNSRFFLSIPTGDHYIALAELSLELDGGRKLDRLLEPNQPLRLDATAGRVRRISLSLRLNGPYRLGLREAALFTPTALDFRQAYHLLLPHHVTLQPTPRFVNDENNGWFIPAPGRISGIFTDPAPLHWRTPLEPGLDGLRGIHLNYRLPRTSATDDTACPLDIKVLGTRASRTFQICPRTTEGYLFLPFARLSDGQALDLGTVSDLEWTLRPPLFSKGEGLGVREAKPATNPGQTADPAAFVLDFTVEGFTERSAEQQLADTPLFTVNGKPVRVAPPSSDEEQPLLRPWRALSPAVLRDLFATQGQIANSDHPWFYVERIVAEPTPPLPLETWLALIQPPEPAAAPPRWPQWLALPVAAAALWLGWRRRWQQRGCAALCDRGQRLADKWRASLETVRQGLQALGRAISQRLAQWAAYGHTAIGLVALIPGLWWAGQLGFTTEGLLVLMAALLIAVAAVRHRRIALASMPIVSPLSARPMIWTPVAGFFTFWWLGWSMRNAPDQSWWWGYLPLGAALYWEWETLKRFIGTVGQAGWRMLVGHRHLLRNMLRLLVWGGLTAFLYRRGLTTPPAGSENYAFTFGGMTAVMMLRALLLAFESLARRWLPGTAGAIYNGAGSLHFSGALLMLIATAITLALKREALAEQLAIIVYYGLVAGTFKELLALRRWNREEATETTGS